LQKRQNTLKSGLVAINSRVVIQIWAGNSVFGEVIQLPPHFIFGMVTSVFGAVIQLPPHFIFGLVIWFLPRITKTCWCNSLDGISKFD